MLLRKKGIIMLFILTLFLNACSHTNKKSDKEQQTIDSQSTNNATNFKSIEEPTPEQQSAFDALNTLQVSTDEMNRLYSTFAGIDQPCYPPDTSMTISQSELLIAVKKFVTSNCRNLSAEKLNELATTAVLAQKKYTLLLCLENPAKVDYQNGAPMIGTWILPNILGRRDLIIVW